MRTLADLCGSGEEEGVGVFYLLLPQSSLHSTCFTHMIKKYKMSHFSPYTMTQGKGNYPTNKLAKLRRCASQVHFEKYSLEKFKIGENKSVATSLVMVATSLVMVATSLVMVVTPFVMGETSLVMARTSLMIVATSLAMVATSLVMVATSLVIVVTSLVMGKTSLVKLDQQIKQWHCYSFGSKSCELFPQTWKLMMVCFLGQMKNLPIVRVW